MVRTTVKEFRCSTCPYRFTLTGQFPVREGGVQMLPGRTYCKGGKKYRAFRSHDRKSLPPLWCPKRKTPCEFRIYTYKDTNTCYLHRLLHQGESVPPSGYQCAVRLSGTLDMTPAAFFSMSKEKSATELLGVQVNSGEIVEIDDGLKPCCFYVECGEIQYLPYWNAEKARENHYQGITEAE